MTDNDPLGLFSSSSPQDDPLGLFGGSAPEVKPTKTKEPITELPHPGWQADEGDVDARDAILGAIETGASGIVDTAFGLGAKVLEGGKNLLYGTDRPDRGSIEQAYGESGVHKLLAPETKTGNAFMTQLDNILKQYEDWVPQTAENLVSAVPFIGPDLAKNTNLVGGVAGVGAAIPDLSMVEGIVRPVGEAIKSRFTKPSGPPVKGLDAVKAAQAELDKQPTAPDVPQVDSNDPLGIFAKEPTPIQKNVADLHDQDIQKRLQEIDAQQSGIEDQQAASQQSAQEQIDRRQQLMEDDVKRQTALGQNAAEYQRQLGAGLPDSMQQEAARRAYEDSQRQRAQEMAAQRAQEEQQRQAAAQADQERVQKQADAQAAIEARQRQLEQEVAQRGTLDYGAAERTRQGDKLTGAEFTDEALANHPDVAKAQEMNNRMYDTALKMSAAVEDGSLHPNILNRFYKDLDMSDAGVAALKEKVSQEMLRRKAEEQRPGVPAFTGRDPFKGPGRKQAGAINPEIFRDGFEKVKQLANNLMLKAHSDGQMLHIDAIRNGQKIGTTSFDPKYAADGSRNLEAAITKVDPLVQRQGIATEMYKFANELGNDIRPSGVQTRAGQSLWNGFQSKGNVFDKTTPINRGPMRGQRGAVMFGNKTPLEKVLGRENMISTAIDPKQAIEASRGLPDSKNINSIESGGALTAMKRGSPIIRAAYEYVTNATKSADLAIRNFVNPVREELRGLTPNEMIDLSQVLREEEMNNKRFDPAAIQKLSAAQQVAYAKFRDLMDKSFDIQNQRRVVDGKPAITRREAYLSANWHGDYRQPVYQAVLDKEGNPIIMADGSIKQKLVWYLAADSKFGLNQQIEALRAQHPDLKIDPKDQHVVRQYQRKTDMQSVLPSILDILDADRDDPAVQKLMAAVQDQQTGKGASFLGQTKHFEDKAGVRGFVGDRPGKVGSYKEAADMFNQQMRYAENSFRWVEMQKATDNIKQITSDADLVQNQPNNIAYINQYAKNAMGRGAAQWTAALSDAIRNRLGVSPKVLEGLSNNLRGLFVLQKLAFSTGYSIMQTVQSTFIYPHLVTEFTNGTKGNFATAFPTGVAMGLAAMGKHYADYILDSKSGIPQDKLSFYGQAMKYAEDNGITTQSIVTSDPISTSHPLLQKAADLAGRTISLPEGVSRSIAFMTAVEFLRSSGKYDKAMDVFKQAEYLTNVAVADHRTTERPMVFNEAGGIGKLAGNLQTWPINMINQYKHLGIEALKGNAAPFLTLAAIQYTLAGVMGQPFMKDAEKLYELIRDHAVPNSVYVKMMQSDFWRDPKSWMIQNLNPSYYQSMGEDMMDGVFSRVSGLGMTNRLAGPAGSEMLQNPAAPFVDLTKQIYHAGKAVYDPEKGFFDKDNIAQAAMASSPPGLQGLVEKLPVFEGSTYNWRTTDKGEKQRVVMAPSQIGSNKQGVYARDSEDDTIRNFGLKSNKETLAREAEYKLSNANSTINRKANDVVDLYTNALTSGNENAANDAMRTHIMLTGQPVSDATIQSNLIKQYTTTFERAGMGGVKSILALQELAKAKALNDKIQQEYNK